MNFPLVVGDGLCLFSPIQAVCYRQFHTPWLFRAFRSDRKRHPQLIQDQQERQLRASVSPNNYELRIT
ncbi:hypothetical protein GNF10_12560 [Nostoc sp. UCD121]|uniref:hypothetical protein n=1 Tax=unclassified Nostoc TaxID=2593658 RepID=UPI00162A1416|nr:MULTISPECIES: hypothetical protein [unclassified Nostoc]MBC1223322.1 hypothetical protein [Nostoc sp. UCD120]MBC1276793.1 hypothetical protein [Nostoc sp. UCD121]MBC1294195.1 hypothetical protein [Nostoc sp. UCD122]